MRAGRGLPADPTLVARHPHGWSGILGHRWPEELPYKHVPQPPYVDERQQEEQELLGWEEFVNELSLILFIAKNEKWEK